MKIKLCPKCKSRNYNLELDIKISMGIPPNFICEDCGFKSYTYLEKDKKRKLK